MQALVYKLSIKFLISAMVLFSCLFYGITTEPGSKFIINTALQITPVYRQHLKKIKVNRITGTIYHGLALQDARYKDENFALQVNNANLKINWKKLIRKKILEIKITELQGTFNNQPLTGHYDFLINFNQQPNKIYLNSINTMTIGNNHLKLLQQKNAENIEFTLKISQLDVFFPGTLSRNIAKSISQQGSVTISGNISNNLDYLLANMQSKNLIINQYKIDSLLGSPENIINFILDQKKKTSELILDLKDISAITNFAPEITRLKGRLHGKIKFNNDLNNPRITTDLKLQNVTASLPKYGVKIKPLNISLTANNSQTISLSGKGAMRNGPGEFNLQGYINPFDNKLSNSLQINSNEMELMNTPECHLIAALKLQLAFLRSENTLSLTGETNISKAHINLDQQKNSTITKSKDIVISENQTSQLNHQVNDNNFQVLPNIDFRIDPATKLSGKGLDANISGKLKIYADQHNKTIVAEGRVSIKRGIYNLLGKEYVIDKGRITYLPGTIISNPSLDIKITPKSSEMRQQNSEQKFLYIEGTLDKPIINDNGLANEQQVVLQLLSFSNNAISNNIKNVLHLQEFGIQEDDNDANQFKGQTDDESLLGNKNFVIGKKINQNFYIQYLKTLTNTNNTIKLQYKLSPNWHVGVESSNEEGHGADIGFSLEK